MGSVILSVVEGSRPGLDDGSTIAGSTAVESTGTETTGWTPVESGSAAKHILTHLTDTTSTHSLRTMLIKHVLACLKSVRERNPIIQPRRE